MACKAHIWVIRLCCRRFLHERQRLRQGRGGRGASNRQPIRQLILLPLRRLLLLLLGWQLRIF
jgi:hypothetical protein